MQNPQRTLVLMGLVQFVSKFIPNLSTVSEPIQKLARKNENFVWGIEQEKSFTLLKACITSSNVLAYFKENCRTRIVPANLL